MFGKRSKYWEPGQPIRGNSRFHPEYPADEVRQAMRIVHGPAMPIDSVRKVTSILPQGIDFDRFEEEEEE